MRKLLLLLAALMISCTTCFAAVDKNANIAVMDFGTRPRASPAEINVNNAEHTSSEYIITRLINTNSFNVVDKDFSFKKLQDAGVNTTGIIDPDTAKRIGELLGVKYIIYGNVTNVNVSNTGTQIVGDVGGGVNVCTVQAHILARLMDVNTGDVLMISKGDGKSKSSYTKVAAGGLAKTMVVKIGTVKVTQDSVHNAIQKAAFMAVDDMMKKI